MNVKISEKVNSVPFDFEKFSKHDIIIGVISLDKFRLEDFKYWATTHRYNPDSIMVTDEKYYMDNFPNRDPYINANPQTTRIALASVGDLMYSNMENLNFQTSHNITMSDALCQNEAYILSSTFSKIIDDFWRSKYQLENLGPHSPMAQTIRLGRLINEHNTITIEKNYMDINNFTPKEFQKFIFEYVAMRHEVLYADAKRIDTIENSRRSEIPLSKIIYDKLGTTRAIEFNREI